MEIGPRYLGFALPFDLTWRQGGRDKYPGRGICSECGNSRDKVYVRWDGTPYCRFCIELDLASAQPKRGQKHPAEGCPTERVWDVAVLQGAHDSFNPTFWSKALGT